MTTSPVITHMKPRGVYIVIGALGVAVIILAVLLVAVERQATSNQATVRQLAGVVGAERQDVQELTRLVQALQQQVRDCRHHRRCGPPLTQAPTEQTQPGTTGQPTGSPSSGPSSPAPTSQPRPTRTPRPRPTPHPSVSPSPSPSPTPTCSLRHLLRCA